MPLMTLASAPKPFTDAHISMIQWNAIQSWMHLGEEVEVLLVGDEPGMDEVAAETGARHLKEVARNAYGTPLVSSIFEQMRGFSASPVLMYVNADILLLPDLLDAVRNLMRASSAFLGVGQRWDLDLRARLDFTPGWAERLMEDLRRRGQLHAPVGSDYFIFPRRLFTQMPDFAIGRAGWDNWMIYEARRRGWQVVDLTPSLTVIHQNHDYRHLPGGQPHYRLPESAENIRQGGGRRTVFTLLDANYHLQGEAVQPIRLAGKKLLREIEIFPLIRLHSRLLAEIFFAVFHPLKAWGEWRGRLAYWFHKARRKTPHPASTAQGKDPQSDA